MIEEQLGFAILHQPRPRVLPRCRQLVRKRKRKSKPGKIYQRLLQSKAKQFWYQLAWYQQLWSNNYHHSNNDPKVDGSCKKEDWQTSNNPKMIHCQRPPNVKNVVVVVTCGGIRQQWMKARWRRRTRWERGPQCGRQRHKWWNPKMESIKVTNSIHAFAFICPRGE